MSNTQIIQPPPTNNQPMLTLTQKQTAQSLVNIFETGSVLGDYGNVTVINGDSGHLSFGRSQTTLGSGGLYTLLQRYCNNPGARFGKKISAWLARVKAKDFSLDKELKFHNVLRASADDKVMRDTQDQFFDEQYWLPTLKASAALGIVSPLGIAVVYDSAIHGGWKLNFENTNQQYGILAIVGEQAWIKAYVSRRREWLANSPRPDLQRTVYRMDAMLRLIALDAWGLELPLVVRNMEISLLTLNAIPANCYDGPQPGSRSVALKTPLARGLDVRLIQLALSEHNLDVKADGVFGRSASDNIKAFQIAQGLPATGVADPALIMKLLA